MPSARTTITLDQALHDEGRRLADALGVTFSDLVAASLRERLARVSEGPRAARFELVTFGGDGLRAGITWSDLASLGTDAEAERYPMPGPRAPPLAAEPSSPSGLPGERGAASKLRGEP